MRRMAYAGMIALVLLAGSCGDEASETSDGGVTYGEVSIRLAELADDDAAVRARAARALGDAWPEGARSVPVLAEALDDEAPGVREATAASLERLGLRAVDPILAFLHDEEDPERRGLLRVIAEIRSLGAKVTPRDFAGYMKQEPRGGIVAMGMGMGVSRHAWLPLNQANRDHLAFLGYCADAGTHQALGIDDPKWPGTASAACAFAGLLAVGPSDVREVPTALLALCDDENPELAALASIMLVTWGAEAREGDADDFEPEPLRELTFGDTSFEGLLDGLERLRDGPPKGLNRDERQALLAALRRTASSLDPLRRKQLAEAILGARGNAAGGAELGRLGTDLLGVLASLGEDAAVAVPWLVKGLEGAEAAWQRTLTQGGGDGGPDDARPGDVVGLLIQHGPRFDAGAGRLRLADVLGVIGPPAAEAVPLLERLAANGDPTIRYVAARALRRIQGR